MHKAFVKQKYVMVYIILQMVFECLMEQSLFLSNFWFLLFKYLKLEVFTTSLWGNWEEIAHLMS